MISTWLDLESPKRQVLDFFAFTGKLMLICSVASTAAFLYPQQDQILWSSNRGWRPAASKKIPAYSTRLRLPKHPASQTEKPQILGLSVELAMVGLLRLILQVHLINLPLILFILSAPLPGRILKQVLTVCNSLVLP